MRNFLIILLLTVAAYCAGSYNGPTLTVYVDGVGEADITGAARWDVLERIDGHVNWDGH